MVSYERALKKAKKLKPNIDNCQEFDNAFMFGCHAEDLSFGGDGPVVILKDGGRAIGVTAYYDEYAGELLREIDV